MAYKKKEEKRTVERVGKDGKKQTYQQSVGREGIFERKGAIYISFTDASGRRVQRKLKGVVSRAKAREIRNAELAKADKARTLGYTEPTKQTFAAIIPKYLKHQKARLVPASYERSRGIAETHLKDFFGPMPVAGIRRQDVQKYITNRRGLVSNDTVIKEINVLKHLFGLCVDWEWIAINPAHRMGGKKDNMRASPGRVRYLLPEEVETVLAACPEWLQPIAGLLVYTGMRRGEVLGLRWQDVDFAGERIILSRTKNGDGRVVPLNATATGVLNALPRRSPTIFPDDITPGRVTIAFRRVCRKIGIVDFKLHDLRHTNASHLRMNGADLQDVAAVLGHRDLRMTQRYAHLSGDHLSAAVKRLDAVFAAPPPAPPKLTVVKRA